MGNTNDLYDLAPDSATPTGAKRKAPPEVLTYRRAETPAIEVPTEPEAIRSVYMPLWLLAGGIVVEVAATLLRERDWRTGLTLVGVQVIAGTAVLTTGVLLAARWRTIDLGRLPVAAMKLAAVMMAPAAVFTLVTVFLGEGLLGGLAGFVISFVLYFALLGAFFDLDESDTWYCVWVIFLVRLTLYFAIVFGVVPWLA